MFCSNYFLIYQLLWNKTVFQNIIAELTVSENVYIKKIRWIAGSWQIHSWVRKLSIVSLSFIVGNPGAVWELIWTGTVKMGKICDGSFEETENVLHKRAGIASVSLREKQLAQSALQYSHSCIPLNQVSNIYVS